MPVVCVVRREAALREASALARSHRRSEERMRDGFEGKSPSGLDVPQFAATGPVFRAIATT